MSQTATVPATRMDGFRPGHSPEKLEPKTSAQAQALLTSAAKRLPREKVEELAADIKWHGPLVADFYENEWSDQKIEQVMSYVGGATAYGRKLGLYSEGTEMVLNQGAQGIVGAAVGIMALLMIGVVVLGKIDGFTPSLDSTWSNTADNVSEQSQSTFSFLNLVPFLLVALFVLGLMMSRM